MHYGDMSKALNRVMGLEETEFSCGNGSRLDEMSKAFEARVDEAKEIVMQWEDVSHKKVTWSIFYSKEILMIG